MLKQLKISLLSLFLISGPVFSQVINLRGTWKFHVGDDHSFASPDTNDAGWESIRVPGSWEDQGFNGYDGFAWYRIKFDGRKLNKSSGYYVNLGYVDDADEAYLNGKFIGFSGQLPPKFKTAYNNERTYLLPAQLINFEGTNTLAVRVFDAMHQGGIVDGEIGIYRLPDNDQVNINLQGIWSLGFCARGQSSKQVSEWVKIMVPGPWEYQGYKTYDGFAWYRKTFTVPAGFTREPLVLLLGKIDDFDRAYLNGTLIGSTNDRRPYGESQSYQVERVYDIPPQLLKRNATNILEIYVEDMGNFGGIWEGVIGITTKSNYKR